MARRLGRRRSAREDPAAFRQRKLPRQERSAATVDAIVEATARLLVERGYEGTTTRRVAERAGVSVGSLYQYFPSRDALVTAVIEHHVDEVLDGIGTLLRRLETAAIDRAVGEVVGAVLELHDRDPGLHVILMEQLPRADRAALLAKIDRVLGAHFRAFCRGRPDLARLDVARAMSVLARACMPIIHLHADGEGGPPDRRAEDLVLLVGGYLRAATERRADVDAPRTRTSLRRDA